jgi:hypothetical protein
MPRARSTYQKWYGMKPTTPIISGGMNALRLPGFFENLGHGNVINTSGGGAYGHIDSPAAGAISLRQSYECWKSGADPIPVRQRAPGVCAGVCVFPGDADKLYPGWREKLACIGKSFAQKLAQDLLRRGALRRLCPPVFDLRLDFALQGTPPQQALKHWWFSTLTLPHRPGLRAWGE